MRITPMQWEDRLLSTSNESLDPIMIQKNHSPVDYLEAYQRGRTFENFLASAQENRDLWLAMAARANPESEAVSRISHLSGVWRVGGGGPVPGSSRPGSRRWGGAWKMPPSDTGSYAAGMPGTGAGAPPWRLPGWWLRRRTRPSLLAGPFGGPPCRRRGDRWRKEGPIPAPDLPPPLPGTDRGEPGPGQGRVQLFPGRDPDSQGSAESGIGGEVRDPETGLPHGLLSAPPFAREAGCPPPA